MVVFFWICDKQFLSRQIVLYSARLRDAKSILLQPMNLTGTSMGLPKSLTIEHKFKSYVGLGPKFQHKVSLDELLCILIYHKKWERPRYWKVLRYLNRIAVKCLKYLWIYESKSALYSLNHSVVTLSEEASSWRNLQIGRSHVATCHVL